MEQKKSKYDTNPLDPEVAQRSDDEWGARRATMERPAETEDVAGATREISRPPQSAVREDVNQEAPTRRYDGSLNIPTSYPSVFVPPVYHPPPAPPNAQGVYGGAYTGAPQSPGYAAASGAALKSPPTARPVRGLNLPENVANILPYLPFPFVGAVLGAMELYLVPRDEARTRFHASQGLAAHLIVLAVSILTSTVDNFLRGGPLIMLKIVSGIFSLAAFIFLIVSMVRVWKGEPYVITPIGELTRWLNEKIEPRK